MKKKLQLELADLRVDSFEAAADAPERGTVAGNELTEQSCPRLVTCGNTCDPNAFSCNGQDTCYGGTCPDTYYVTCIPNCTNQVC
ncbi:MAG: hypothetical protein ACJ8GN_16055 [Longimicrobiaceae bacterium]